MPAQILNQHTITKFFSSVSPAVGSKASSKTQIAKTSLSPEHTAAPVFYTALWGQSTHQRPAELRTMDFKAESYMESPAPSENSRVYYCIAK